MDSKFYVSLEAAKLLKEKGYRQTYHAYYFGNSNLRKGGYRGDSWYDSPDFYPAPTKAEVIDWLESKGIIVELSYDDQAYMDNARWNYFIYTHDNDGWVEALVCSWYENDFYQTRLEAEEDAIIKALTLL
jgi:hypothetical protein